MSATLVSSNAVIPRSDHGENRDVMADPGYFLTPGQLATVTSIASVLGGFVAKWLFDRWWKKKDEGTAKLEAARDSEIASIKKMLGEFGKSVNEELRAVVSKMDTGFGEVRGLINKQDLKMREIEIKLDHEKEAREKLEEIVASVPKMISDSRHALRNQLHREAMYAAKMRAKGVAYNPLTDPMPGELVADDDKPTDG